MSVFRSSSLVNRRSGSCRPRSAQTCWIVVDAKDYAQDTWRGTADLSKQALYQDLISRHVAAPVGSCFAFPASTPGVTHRGTHKNTVPDRRFEIVGLDLNLPQVMNAYRAGRMDPTLCDAVTKRVRAQP